MYHNQDQGVMCRCGKSHKVGIKHKNSALDERWGVFVMSAQFVTR